MSIISKLLSRLGRRAPWRPSVYANPNFSRYYPVQIGQVFADRYQVVGKLGFGATSTVWLAHDLCQDQHVALIVFIRSQALGDAVKNELFMYKRIEQHPSNHAGRNAIRTLVDSFQVTGPDGQHLVLAHPPLGDSLEVGIRRSSIKRLPTWVLRYVLKNILLALVYLHAECQIIHTDIKDDNIMFRITDPSILTEFAEQELQDPCPRKELEGRTIYTSRAFKFSDKVGPLVVCDFGAAVFADGENVACVQPQVYRAPEAWNLFEGDLLFHGIDPQHLEYRRRTPSR
ncbi:hypothetical protein ACQRIU_004319 [Beauveria bassiana]